MTIDLDTLEAAAKAATPGPWNIVRDPDGYTHYIGPSLVTQVRDDAAYIAAANPAVVLELIAEIRRLRMGIRASAKEHICNNCEIHCEYEGEPMTSCFLERVANPGRW